MAMTWDDYRGISHQTRKAADRFDAHFAADHAGDLAEIVLWGEKERDLRILIWTEWDKARDEHMAGWLEENRHLVPQPAGE